MKKQRVFKKIILYSILVLISLTIIVPLLWVLVNSFRPDEDIGRYTKFSIEMFFPKNATMDNYIELFKIYHFGRYILNTLVITAIVTAGSLIINSLAAYSFARLKFPGRKLIFTILLITLMVPGEVMLLPQFMIIRKLDLLDKFSALVLPALANAFGIFFFRQAFLDFPSAIEEAATIDGCGKFRIYSRIIMPLTKSPIITMTIMTITGQWDSFIWPLTVLRDSKKYTIQIGVNYLFGQHSNQWGNIFASAIITALPMIILFLFLQKYYVRGITSSGVKG